MNIRITRRELIYPAGSTSFPSVHASTLVFIDRDRIGAAWFGGTSESNPNVRIWFSVRANGSWSAPKAVTPDNGVAHWNPTLFNDGGRLLLIYKEGLSPRCWYSMITESADGGESWSEPRELVPGDVGGRGPVKDKMIRLSNGELLAPASLEDDAGRWGAFADISADGGRTWTSSEPIAVIRDGKLYPTFKDLPPKAQGLIQPTAWEEDGNPGRVHMLMRSNFGKIYSTLSCDFGRTWSPAEATELPNNNSGIDCVKAAGGAVVLIYNPVAEKWGPRTPVSLSMTRDNGASWSAPVDIEGGDGEFSYPAIISDGGRLCMTYTHKRETIAYAEAELTEA